MLKARMQISFCLCYVTKKTANELSTIRKIIYKMYLFYCSTKSIVAPTLSMPTKKSLTAATSLAEG